jgi:hypothetical protein
MGRQYLQVICQLKRTDNASKTRMKFDPVIQDYMILDHEATGLATNYCLSFPILLEPLLIRLFGLIRITINFKLITKRIDNCVGTGFF